jgi:hypothetical protein
MRRISVLETESLLPETRQGFRAGDAAHGDENESSKWPRGCYRSPVKRESKTLWDLP